MKLAVIVCVLAACVAVKADPDDEDVSLKLTRLENIVLDLTASNVHMQQEMIQLKQELHTVVTAQELETAELRKKIQELERGCASVAEGGSGLEKRLVLANQQVAFTVYLDYPMHNMTSNQPIVYNRVLLNQGNGYSTHTGVFTAPTTGTYLFSYSVGAKALPNVNRTQYDMFTKLVVDGDHMLSAVAESTGTYDDEQGSTTAILYVEEGSQVWTAHQVRGGNSLFSSNEERMSSFAGVLLYQM